LRFGEVQARHLEELSLNQLAPAINGRRLHGDHTKKGSNSCSGGVNHWLNLNRVGTELTATGTSLAL
jgi:hypothetical protein